MHNLILAAFKLLMLILNVFLHCSQYQCNMVFMSVSFKLLIIL